MPVPTTIADLSTTAASNGPDGATEAGSVLDDYLQAVQALLRQGDTRPASVASASSTAIGAAAGRIVSISGTTTITSFGTISAGIWRIVTFEGVVTLTHNATSLILPGGANITTVAGDSLIAESLGSGNWKVHAFFRAAAPSNITYSGGTVTIDSAATDEALKINGTGSPNIGVYDSGTKIGVLQALSGQLAVYAETGKKLQLGADQSIDWEIDTAGRLLNVANAQPSFSAHTSTSQDGSNIFTAYTAEDHDHGSWFNATTGVATAPVAGKYFVSFTASLTTTIGEKSITYALYKNGSSLAGRAITVTSSADNASCTLSVVVALAANDTISVVEESASGSGTVAANFIVSFSATLLS